MAFDVRVTRPLSDIDAALAAADAPAGRIAHVLELLQQLVPHRDGGVFELRPGAEARLFPTPGSRDENDLRRVGSRLLILLGETLTPTVALPESLARQMPWTSFLAVPLVSLDHLLGVLMIGRGHGPAYDEADLSLLSIVASKLGGYLAALRREEERERHAQALADAFAGERSAREAAEKANRAKDDFVSLVSHELRTPLSAILGWTKLLRTGVVKDAAYVEQALASIERNAESQARLVDDLLDLSRITGGRLFLDKKTVDPADVVRAVAAEMGPIASARRLTLRAVFEAGAGPVDADPDRLRQIVANLLSNGLKFTPAGGEVEVRVRRGVPGLVIEVQDNGEGIDPAFLPHVFESFRQADAAGRGGRAGLGLGLAIVRHLVELHGGSVEVTSPGKGAGTRVRVSLPNVEGRSVEVTTSKPAATCRASLQGIKVLVVDDVADARDFLRQALGDSGATVSAVGSGAEAIESYRRDRPDIVLADIAMPGMDGYELIRHLRTLDAGDPPPAVALTAFAGSEHRRRAIDAGYHRHLAKPIAPAALVHALVEVLENRR